jgi:hypothetical protein
MNLHAPMNAPALIRSVSPAIAAGIVAALCGITALGAAQPAAAVLKLDAKYTNKPQGLVLRFPAGWDLEDLGAQPGDRWDLLVLNPVEDRNNAGIHLTVYRQKGNADELFQQFRADYGKPDEAVIGSEGATEIDGQSSRFFTVTYTNRFEQRYHRVYVATAHGSVYVFRCFMDDSGDAATAALLDRVVQEVWFR